MADCKYFDYIAEAEKQKITPETLKEIEEETRKEFPHDQLQFELHVFRAIKSREMLYKYRNSHSLHVKEEE